MKPKTLILMGVAITCGLGASYMTSRLLAERSSSEQDKIKVLVARKNLNMGDAIKLPDDMFEEKEFLRGTEPRNSIDNFESLRGRVLKRGLRSGDFVTNDDLMGDKDGGLTLQYVLPPGYRAVGVRVDMEAIAGGFASLPMSRVDIISTVRANDNKSSYSQILLEDVLVVAADTQMHRDEAGRAMPANVVTVAVKPEDALKLRLAGSMGSLSMVLRKLNDSSKAKDDTITAEKLKSKSTSSDDTEFEIANSGAPKSSEPKVVQPKEEKVAAVAPPAPGATAKEPDGKQHVLTILEGDAPARRTPYLLNDAGEVVTPLEVTRTELQPPLPTATVPAPPVPQTPPAPQAPTAPTNPTAPTAAPK